MSAFATAILAVLLAGPRHVTDKDEAIDARRARLGMVAVAIADASKGDAHKAALLVAQARGETNLARYVQEGRCADGPRGARCDPDKNGVARARTPWQTWRVSCPAAWQHPAGSQAELTAAASCTLRLMGAGKRRCTLNGYPGLEGAFAGARGGASCRPPRAAERIKTYRWAYGRLTGRKAES